ncbi:hypothetical protein [Saccharospirillum alexandrii]|uniref:hypothetical protein n=1 Tax=Saccharospirillum alexandrii TaxID=2448477 RepID=UPI003736A4C6
MRILNQEQRRWFKALLAEGIGVSFWAFAGIAGITGGLVYYFQGPDSFYSTGYDSLASALGMMPRVLAALTMAGMIWVLLPREALSRFVGRSTGLVGLVFATIAGVITLGGPSSAFPLLAVLAAAGADRGILIAFITSWATLGLQRTIMWDLPLMGPEFTMVRILASLPLPIIAGLIARRIPIELTLKTDPDKANRLPPDEDDLDHLEERP